MRIDDAITELQRLKKQGVRSLLVAWWQSQDFARKDDADWEYDSAYAERHMDWSYAHDGLDELIGRGEEV
jgi:DNA-binding sugar fermentation-stimulating protein